tara:strand:+ start:2883 stop:3203 length:321 start_codon:yes stop_codon:yes gene_type:complete
MNLNERLEKFLKPTEEDVMLYDDYEDAFIGLGYQQYNGPIAIYDASKCIEILTNNFMDDPDCNDWEDANEMAVEYFDYNSVGAWYGDKTPIFIMATNEDINEHIGE